MFTENIISVFLFCATLLLGSTNSQIHSHIRPPLENRMPVPAVLGAPSSEWSVWSEWSECSRTCGGGMQEQHRRCHRREQSIRIPGATNGCRGSYKQYQACGGMPCPDGSANTRRAHCAEYNKRLFAGNTYIWEPMSRGGPCQLNCRARGHRFFVRHSSKVTDGTDCSYSTLSSRERNYLGGLHGRPKHLCVEGRCMKIGCDGKFGSGATLDKCGVCGGNRERCRYFNGIFRPTHLSHDFHRVVIIPAGAERVNITEVRKSKSCIALRSAGNPSQMYINADLKLGLLDPSGRYNVAGTSFDYQRPRLSMKGETMTAKGPTTEDLEVLLYFQHDNPGIQYEYITPRNPPITTTNSGPGNPRASELDGGNSDHGFDLAHRDGNTPSYPTHTGTGRFAGSNTGAGMHIYRNRYTGVGRGSSYYRNRNRNYGNRISDGESVDREDNSNVRREITRIHRLNGPIVAGGSNPLGRTKWMKVGFGQCSQSCAEGKKTSIIKCIQLSSRQTVDDQYCTGQRPNPQVRRCNRQPCPAYYDVGEWLECSRTCGYGRRTRTVICRQLFAGNFTSAVSHSRCRRLTKPASHERCSVRECAHWEPAAQWSPCSSRCGAGTQTRHSVCKNGDGQVLSDHECGSARRPATMRSCDAGPCLTKWFFTDWEQCSADCDRGQQRRNVVCINTADSAAGCQRRHQPDATRTCARSSCGVKYEWFAGNWGPCSSNCGNGVQNRKVTCLSIAADGTMSVATGTNNRLPCLMSDKPDTQRPCNTQACGSRWHYTLWTECSVSCGGGSRTRDVHCLDESGGFSSLCNQSQKPKNAERCNTVSCFALRVLFRFRSKLRGSAVRLRTVSPGAFLRLPHVP
ncbi:thrombospondin type-1 domain-containing protein 4-like isoform X2 [Ciona intestinalis]